MSNGNIFISYRREDTSGHAGRLYDRLKEHFPDRVVMDVASIELGADFVEEIERQLGSCLVFIELIGHEWATITDHDGRRRLDAPGDFVRLEVAIALRRAITVIPILVEGASMPDGSSLPEDIAPLVRHEALAIVESDFDHNVERLIHRLESIFGPTPAHAPLLPPPPRAKERHPARLALLIGIAFVGLCIVGVIGLFVLIYSVSPDTTNEDSKANSAEPATAGIHIDQIKMAKDGGGQPGETATSFEPRDNPIYCVITLNKAQTGTAVRFIWKAVDVTGSPNQTLATIDYATKTAEKGVNNPVTTPGGWAKGSYTVEVYVNGALDKTISYTVE
jgi:hypothetical protein